MKKPILVPSVQNIELKEEKYIIPSKVKINFGVLRDKPLFFLDDWTNYEETDGKADITFIFNDKLHNQGYRIVIEDEIVIEYSESSGAFYALTTLKQLFLTDGKTVNKLIIEDWPDIANRGLMLDVSRGRLTKISVIKDLVDWLVSLKYNQLQLYFEAIVFDYPGFEKETAGKVKYTADEIRELDSYCKERFMQLVPNQNSFGHMSAWMREPSFSHLAITKDDGIKSGVLNPLKPASLEFMDKIYGALLPNFESEYINIGCDETWELGMGETEAACREKGRGNVYLDYLLELYKLVTEKYNRIPMFWDDIAMHHPELITRLPKDIIVLEWGYEFDHPFEKHCKILYDAQLPFYVVPGTSTWNSVCGRTTNMLENLRSAAECARKYGAEGYLLTDWGDGGHPQPLACSMVSYVIGSMYAWHVDSCERDNVSTICKQAGYFSDKFIFNTDFKLFDWLLRLGKCHQFQGGRRVNAALIWENFRDGHLKHFPLINLYASELSAELENVELNCKYSDLIKRELLNACLWLMIVSDPYSINGRDEIWKNEYEKLWNLRSLNSSAGCGENINYMINFAKCVAENKKAGVHIPKAVADIQCSEI